MINKINYFTINFFKTRLPWGFEPAAKSQHARGVDAPREIGCGLPPAGTGACTPDPCPHCRGGAALHPWEMLRPNELRMNPFRKKKIRTLDILKKLDE